MDKNSAINLIKDTFNAKFDESKFTLFIKNFLNDLEPKSNSYSGNLLWDDYKEHINSYKRIGKYTDPEGDALDVLIVQVKSVTKLQKARTTLRNFVIKHLSKFEKDYALVAFYSKEDEGADWRFSFIKLEHQSYLDEEKQKVKTRKEFTPAKRYSFLVGEYEDSHTAKNQLLPLLQNIANNPTLEELETAFSIEKVTDEFFGQYKDLFIKLSFHFDNDEHIKAELKEANIDNSRFTKKLLGQIVFLYFLQKKGWLGVPEKETWGKGDKRFLQDLFAKADDNNKNYFNAYLQPLFYEALAKERNNENSYYKKFNCRIPFLNGGLFEAEYNWQKANISIPEYLFRNEDKNIAGDIGTGVLDVFDRYNFTIKEDEPLDKEVAVDPEMLGKVFENMLDITERKSKGAFYTPREIVHYMCQESLIHYLDNCLNYDLSDSGITLIEKKDIETYIRKGHFALENDQRVANKGESKTYKYIIPESIRQNAELIDQKLSEIKILDPAIGSGAFPVGLLHELVNAQLVIKPHFSKKYTQAKLVDFGFNANETDISESRYVYRLKRHIIQESIYGVDIDASAIDIARLRLWLSLVVDEDDFDPIETLPNLDYKIVCGNSLISRYDIDMPIEKVFKEFNKDRDDKMDLDKYKALVNAFMGESDHDKKEEFRTLIAEIKSAFKIYFSQDEKLKLDKLKVKLNDLDNNLFSETKSSAEKKRIKELKVTITKKEKERNDIEQAKIYENAIEWRFEFPNLLNDNGDFVGFDVVIGNPPYINIANIKDSYIRDFLKNNYEVARNKSDLYSFFTEKGQRILKDSGVLYFIVSNSWLGIDSFLNFRKFLVQKTKVIDLVKCKGDVFDATVTPVIFGFINTPVIENKITLHSLFEGEFSVLQSKIDYQDVRKIPSFPFSFERQITFKIKTEKLGSVAHFTLGIKTSNDSKFISNETFQDNSYPLIRGKDIARYKTKYSGKYIWYRPDLMTHKKGAGPRKLDYFLGSEKIVIKDVANKIEATLDRKMHLTNDTLNSIYKIEKYSFNYILALLNSEVVNVWYKNIFSSGLHIKLNEIKEIPVASISSKYSKNVDCIVEYLLLLNNSISLDYFEAIVNGIIYEVYFPSEIKSAGKEILKHLGGLKPITDEMSEEEKLAIIQSEFERLYDPNHPVRNNIETLDSIEEVRIIKESLNH